MRVRRSQHGGSILSRESLAAQLIAWLRHQSTPKVNITTEDLSETMMQRHQVRNIYKYVPEHSSQFQHRSHMAVEHVHILFWRSTPNNQNIRYAESATYTNIGWYTSCGLPHTRNTLSN